ARSAGRSRTRFGPCGGSEGGHGECGLNARNRRFETSTKQMRCVSQLTYVRLCVNSTRSPAEALQRPSRLLTLDCCGCRRCRADDAWRRCGDGGGAAHGEGGGGSCRREGTERGGEQAKEGEARQVSGRRAHPVSSPLFLLFLLPPSLLFVLTFSSVWN